MEKVSNEVKLNRKNNWVKIAIITALVLATVAYSFPFLSYMFGDLFDYISFKSKYNNKVYTVKSSDGKISGTIGVKIYSCGETGKGCATVNYNLIINDNISANKININPKNSDFNSNYYYISSIYDNKNVESGDNWPQDYRLMPVFCNYDKMPSDPFSSALASNDYVCGNVGPQAASTNKFIVSFSMELNRMGAPYHYPDDFLKETQLNIYDVSSAMDIDKYENNRERIFEMNYEQNRIISKSYNLVISPR